MMAGRGDELPVSALPDRRHLSSGHGRLREAQHFRARAALGAGHLHPVRQLQLCLPAQRDPLEVLSSERARGRAGELQVGADRCPRLPGNPLFAPDLRRGLHRLRALRRGLPGQEQGADRGQGDQPSRQGDRSRPGPRGDPLLRDVARERPQPGRFLDRARRPVPRAAVRVFRRLRRLRRDALHQAGLAAVRRSHGGRERHRLLLDLWRQPADHALGEECRRARPRLVQLAVRGQRRVRPRHAARGRSAPCARRRPREGAGAPGRQGLVGEILARPSSAPRARSAISGRGSACSNSASRSSRASRRGSSCRWSSIWCAGASG